MKNILSVKEHKSVFPMWLIASPVGFAFAAPEAIVMRLVRNFKGRKLLKANDEVQSLLKLNADVKKAEKQAIHQAKVKEIEDILKA